MARDRDGSSALLATLAVGMAAVCFGSVPYFAKTLTDAGMVAPAIAFYRYLLVAVVLSPFLLLGTKTRSATAWGALAGAAMGLGWTGFVKSIALIPVATAGIVYMSYPVFTLVIAWLWFRQPVTARSSASAAMILIASLLVSAPTRPLLDGESTGLLFAFVAPVTFAFAIHVIASKLDGIPPLSRVASLAFGAAIALLPLVLSFPASDVLPSSASGWWQIAGIGLVTALIPQLLYVGNAPLIGATKSAMLGGLELPTMILIGWLAFDETLGPLQLAAAALVLLAIALTRRLPSRL